MKTRAIAVSIVLLAGGLSFAQLGGYAPEKSKDKPVTSRTLVGQVMDKSEAPLGEAVVHLKNTKTMAEKTYIADKDGNYRFPALAMNVDYEVYAEYKGKKSDTKTLSAFDSRAKASLNLKIDTRQK